MIKLSSVERCRSPMGSSFVRLTGHFKAGNGTEDFDVWFDVDEELAGGFSESGAPWLIAAIPYGFELGGTIAIERPTDAMLLENTAAFAHIFRHWYRDLKPFEVIADKKIVDPGGEKAFAFFSGGIDSLHTATRYTSLGGTDQVGSVDELLLIWGFDIELDSPSEFAALQKQSEDFAARLGVPLRVMATNIRRPGTFWTNRWGPLCHALGKAACALALEKRYKKAIWAAGYRSDRSVVEGSHPMTDHYLSSSGLAMVYDGADSGRIDKIAFLSRFPWMLEDIHVCWRGASSRNCGKCPKCLRTEIALELTGMMARCNSLPRVSLERIRKAYCGEPAERAFFTEMAEYAKKIGRSDMYMALCESLTRSRHRAPIVNYLSRFEKTPGLWRAGRSIRHMLGA